MYFYLYVGVYVRCVEGMEGTVEGGEKSLQCILSCPPCQEKSKPRDIAHHHHHPHEGQLSRGNNTNKSLDGHGDGYDQSKVASEPKDILVFRRIVQEVDSLMELLVFPSICR